jgi:hypothetical protein
VFSWPNPNELLFTFNRGQLPVGSYLVSVSMDSHAPIVSTQTVAELPGAEFPFRVTS